MVMTSDQIAAQAASFQQQSMQGIQHAGMVSQFAGVPNSQQAAGNLMGSAMNTAGAIGSPLMTGGAMLAGVDPMTMGLRAAWGARGAGVMGAGMAGVGAAALPMAGMMAAQYAGSQMWQGAQQQQQLQGQLNSTFQFANQYGGRGFTSGEAGGIGQMMRGMSQQRGPGGEFVTMDEMGQLAANMGRMGMAQGVRNAKEFSEKFQQMMKTVKEVATTMSTSLENAQEMISSMRGAGIFRPGQATQMAGMIREGAIGGGLATSELSQMANIGSQISRSVGGRGSAGAFAGVEFMSRLGAAQQIGLVSEEQIYNVTGQTGAAGRQAFAAQQLQGEARFFKSGLGRRVLASVAGRNGQLDEEDMEEWAGGDVGTGRTMQMAYQNLGQVGRANFIRNEGRLRGEAIRGFGGMGRATVARSWLRSRGMDLDDMGDRQMLFFQRRFKFDADEAEAVLGMAKGLDAIQQQRQEATQQDQLVRGLEQERRHVGLEGVKRKFESARKEINDKLQQAGANFYREGSNLIEGFVNKLTGNFVGTVDRDLTSSINQVMRGGFMGREMLATRFGVATPGHEGLMGMQGMDAMSQGIFRGGGSATPGLNQLRRFKAVNEESFQNAGYSITTAGNMQDVMQRIGRAQQVADAVHQTDREAYSIGSVMRTDVQRQMIHGGGGRGMNQLRSFGQSLERMAQRDPAASRLLQRYNQADDAEKSRIMGSVRRGAGLNARADMMESPEVQAALGGGDFATIADRHRAIGEYALGQGAQADFARSRRQTGRALGAVGGAAAGAAAGAGIGLLLGPVGAVVGGIVGGVAGGIGGYMAGGAAADAIGGAGDTPAGNERIWEAYGRYMDTETTRNVMEGMLSRDADIASSARTRLTELQGALLASTPTGDVENLSEDQRGQFEANRSMMMAADFAKAVQQYGSPDAIPPQVMQQLARQNNMTDVKAFKARAIAPLAVMRQKQMEAFKQYTTRAKKVSARRVSEMRRGGVLEAGNLTERISEKFGDIGVQVGGRQELTEAQQEADPLLAQLSEQDESISSGKKALLHYVAAQQARSQFGADAKRNAELEQQAQQDLQLYEKEMGMMTESQRKEFRGALRGERGLGALRQREASIAGITKRIRKRAGAAGKGGVLGAKGVYQQVSREMGLGKQDFEKGDTGAEMGEQLAEQFLGTGEEQLAMQEELLSPEQRDKLARIREAKQGRTGRDKRTRAQYEAMEAQVLEGAGGAEMEGARKTLKQIEEARQSGDADKVGRLTQQLKENPIYQKRIQQQQEKAAHAKDPSFRKLEDVAANTKAMLAAIRNLPGELKVAMKDGPK